MSKFIINDAVPGYTPVDITDESLFEAGSEVYIVLNESANDKLTIYYNTVKKLLKQGIKVWIILVNDDSKIARSICNLMATYENYNIYKVESSKIINSSYLASIAEREVTQEEAATYISADLTAFDDMDSLVAGVCDLIKQNDLDGLRVLIEQHYSTVEAFPDVVNYMKQAINTANMGEWQEKLESLRDAINKAQTEVDEANTQLKEKEQSINDLESTLKDKNRQLAQNRADIEELKSQASSKVPIIRKYSTVSTHQCICKTTNIIYFKEITPIPYINSFVRALQYALKAMKKTVKLLVYDSSKATSITYGAMQQITAADFTSQKDNYLSPQLETFVVTEPAPNILNDIITSINPIIDVLIVYDRMHQSNDLISGNNVTKFWVLNSSNDFKKAQQSFKIINTEYVITPSKRIAPNVIEIPKIPGYEVESTQQGRTGKYKQVIMPTSNKPLMKTIFTQCNIDMRRTSRS